MSKENPVVDSSLDLNEALGLGQYSPAPKEILEKQRIIDVLYYSFDGQIHQGQIVIDIDLMEDVIGAFNLILDLKFPVGMVKPAANESLAISEGQDVLISNLNLSAGFCYRNKTEKEEFSNHAFGRAIDINPYLNPYIRGNVIVPPGAVYDPNQAGTLTPNYPIVKYFKEKGWNWGGEWTDRKDYMHFEKPI